MASTGLLGLAGAAAVGGLEIEVICVGFAVNDGGGAGERTYGFAGGPSSWRDRLADCTPGGEGPPEGLRVGDGTTRLWVGEGGTELCIFIWCWKKDCVAIDGEVDAWCGGSTRLAMDGDALARFDGAGLGDICVYGL